jgi:GntR family transcriptional regulator/MocR family aminotransferase
MGLAQRLELLTLCRRSGAMLLEDDYDSEFRYGGRPLPATQGLDDQGTVIYVGTFSKILFPALRLGYLVAPPGRVQILARAHRLANGQPPFLEQYALADFILEGHLERHIRRMRTIYGRRRDALLSALERELGDRVTVLGEPSGMHVMVRFQTDLDDGEFVRRASAEGVALVPAGKYHLNPGSQAGFVMGFAAMDEDLIRHGIRRLARVLG